MTTERPCLECPKRYRQAVSGILLLTALLMRTGCPAAASAAPLPSGGTVQAVFDGDTILLDTGERVRYLGIDAPEVARDGVGAQCYGDEARRVNEDWVLRRRVSLRYGREVLDRYGRLLAYVLVPDGRCVNVELVRSGHAVFYRDSGQRSDRFEELLEAQRNAVRDRRGMWGNCRVKMESHYVGNRRSFIFHRPDCSRGNRISALKRLRFDSRWCALEEGYRPCRHCLP